MYFSAMFDFCQNFVLAELFVPLFASPLPQTVLSEQLFLRTAERFAREGSFHKKIWVKKGFVD